jgi:arylsulfatase A-like enzyme
MNSHLSRREFLKLAGALSGYPIFKALNVHQLTKPVAKPGFPNIIIILFDALSALHLSCYGYHRKTSPNIDKFANRSTVFRNHYAAGNFTVPSTASLFTGTYPWTHRAIRLGGVINPKVQSMNIFRLLQGTYFQAAFAQNIFADQLLYQLDQYLDLHLPMDSFSTVGYTIYDHLLRHDPINGVMSFDYFLFRRAETHGSLFLSILKDFGIILQNHLYSSRPNNPYPEKLPRLSSTDVYFRFDQVIEGIASQVSVLPQPFFAYLHFMPPHDPYTPTRQFAGTFNDGWIPIKKKRHHFSDRIPDDELKKNWQSYDEFIANIDSDLQKLLDQLEADGRFKDSYIIITSDHGELFERGIMGHSTEVMFQPLIHIPLIIHAPGQEELKTIFSPTSNTDLLPSLLHIAGLPLPDWCEGRPLPELGGQEDPDRSIYIFEAKKNPAFQPLNIATIALIKSYNKLVHYMGYKTYRNRYEFFDLQNDPEELKDQYAKNPLAKEMEFEMKEKLEEINSKLPL